MRQEGTERPRTRLVGREKDGVVQDLLVLRGEDEAAQDQVISPLVT